MLTVQPEKNRRRVVIRAAESFPSLGIRVLGVVINRVSPEKGKGYYDYGYGYGYGYGYCHAADASDEPGGAQRLAPSAKKPRRVA